MKQLYLPFIPHEEIDICYLNEHIKSLSHNGYYKLQSPELISVSTDGNISIKYDNRCILELDTKEYYLTACHFEIESSVICKSFLTNKDGSITPLAADQNFNQYDPYIIFVMNLKHVCKHIPISISVFDEQEQLCYSTFDIIEASESNEPQQKSSYCHGIGIDIMNLNSRSHATYRVVAATLDGTNLINTSITYSENTTLDYVSLTS